jgi:hypothetical protein
VYIPVREGKCENSLNPVGEPSSELSVRVPIKKSSLEFYYVREAEKIPVPNHYFPIFLPRLGASWSSVFQTYYLPS